MFFWNRFPFLRYTTILIFGILTATYHKFEVREFYTISFILTFVLLYTTIIVIKKGFNYFWKNFVLGVLGLIIIFSFGYFIIIVKDFRDPSSHICDKKGSTIINGFVESEMDYGKKFIKVIISSNQIFKNNDWEKLDGKLLLYIKQPYSTVLNYGDEVLIHCNIQNIQTPKNPNEFDYNAYLGRKQIFKASFIENSKIKLIRKESELSIIRFASMLRLYCDQILQKNIPSLNEYQVASALILGSSGDINSEIKQSYQNTGVIHVLAVSGLHIAIIYELMLLLFGFVKRFKFGNYLLYFAVMFMLWVFAFISGLSPSVLRAVVMFTFILIGKIINRDTEIYNSLAASAFLLLCYNPYYIFDVGFQLSYLAVGGIVYLHPRIKKLIEIQNKYLEKIWELISTTIAAQIITLPLILFYFHQLPTWFILANLLMIPGTFIVLYLGIATIAFGQLEIVASYLGNGIYYILKYLHIILIKLEHLPFALISNIHLSLIDCILLYGLLATLLLFFYSYHLSWLVLATFISIFFSASTIFKFYNSKNQKLIVAYNIHNIPTLAFVEGRNMKVFYQTQQEVKVINSTIKNHIIALGVRDCKFIHTDSLNKKNSEASVVDKAKIITWNNHAFILSPSIKLLDKLDIHSFKKSKLLKNYYVHIKNKKCTMVFSVNDENPWNYKILNELIFKNIPFYNLSSQDAFILKLN